MKNSWCTSPIRHAKVAKVTGPNLFSSSRSFRHLCQGRSTPCIGDGHPTFNRNPYNGYINPYYWVDDHPPLYGNNGSLDPRTFGEWVNDSHLQNFRVKDLQLQAMNNCSIWWRFLGEVCGCVIIYLFMCLRLIRFPEIILWWRNHVRYDSSWRFSIPLGHMITVVLLCFFFEGRNWCVRVCPNS